MQTEKRKDWLTTFWDVFYSRLVAPSHLPKPTDVQDEQVKINFLRIVLGLLCLWRTGMMAVSSYYYFPTDGFLSSPPEFWLTLTVFSVALCFTVGLLTPVATIWLLFVYNQVDTQLGTQTLGTNLWTLSMFFFLVANAGSRLSVDALNLQNQKSPLHTVTRLSYGIIKFPSCEQLHGYYWLLLMSYAATSLAAVSLHFDDAFWQAGSSVFLMLNNSFLCSLWPLCRFVSLHFPGLVSAFSYFSCIGQAVYQVAMVPLIYNRWGVWFVGLWGAAFFIISVILLQISWIPTCECVLWAVIFLPAGLVTKPLKTVNTRAIEAARHCNWQTSTRAGLATAATLCAFTLLFFVVLGHHYPSVGLLRKAAKHMGPRLYYLGLDVPDVFNKLDLSTEKYWYVMERQDASGQISHVPIALSDGSREYYHWFDTVYFSNFVPWRRMMGLHAGNPLDLLVPGQGCYELLRRAVQFDRRLQHLPDDTQYRVTVYGQEQGQWTKPPRVVTVLAFQASKKLAARGAADQGTR